MNRVVIRGILLAAFAAVPLLSQKPSVTLTIKEKAGFLGMGGPRVVTIELSTQNRGETLTSENVNSGPSIYFLVTPVADWKIDPDFIKESFSSLIIYQNGEKIPIIFKGEIDAGPPTTVVLGFPKTVKLNQLFLFQVTAGGKTNQAEMNVPQQFWPGYGFVTTTAQQAKSLLGSGQTRAAISASEQILGDQSLKIFPQFEEARVIRTDAFSTYLTTTADVFQRTVVDTGDLKRKIARVETFRPLFQFVIDSLPRAAWNIGSLDANVSPIMERARASISAVQNTRDSLQRALDDKNTRWIIEGSAVGKNGFLYQYMIETLAYALLSVNFKDTTWAAIKPTLPEELKARLERYNIAESYETFLQLCVERIQTNLPMFPVEFLPNLRKDTASFSQPYYSMLKAVNDYYYGNMTGARDETFKVFLTCTEQELNAQLDQMRVLIGMRQGEVSADVVRMLDDAEQLEAKGDNQGALERYRQVTILAPNFAYGVFAFGQYYIRSGEPIRAINFFQRAYQIDSLYLSAYREAAGMYLKQGNYKPMTDVLLYALQHGNDNWEVNSTLGTAFLSDNDPARAIQHFERSLSLNSKSYRTNIQLGLAHQAVKSYQKAREYFNNAIGLDPTRQDAVDYLTRLNELQRAEK